MTKYLILLFLLGLTICPGLLAQDIQFEHITRRDKLPASSVHGMVQSRQGFLWLGTLNGLSRYDGYQIKTYRHNPLGRTSLSENLIWPLYEDREGMLWVGTEGGGLNRFDPNTEVFTRYRHDPEDTASLSSDTVYVILETRDGALWVGTNHGLNRMDPETGVFTRYLHNPGDAHSLAHNTVNALYETRDGTLWVGTGFRDAPHGQFGGLHRLDAMSGDFERILPTALDASLDNRVTAIGADHEGTLYVGTCQSGFYRYDRQQKRLEPLVANPRDPDQLHAPPGTASSALCDQVSFIHEDRAKRLWIGTFSGGVNRYDLATHTLTRFRHNPEDPTSLSSNLVLSFYEDRQGIQWIGMSATGLDKVVPSRQRFRLYGSAEIVADQGVRVLYEDEDGVLWIGTNGGQLFRLDPGARTPARFSTAKPSPEGLWSRTPVNSILKDREGMLWESQADNGLYRIDPESGRITSFFHEFPDLQILTHNSVYYLFEDDEGMLWLNTWGKGIIRYDRTTGEITHFQNDPLDASSLRTDRILHMIQDRQGVRWFATYGGGVNRFDEETETFTTYLDGSDVMELYEDDQGRLWVATATDGLFLLDQVTGHAVHYTTEDGLPNNTVMGINEDEQGWLWISTVSGLVRFNSATETFITYGEADGLDNYPTTSKTLIQNRGGLFFLGGSKGLTVIDPGEFSLNPYPPDVAITGLQVFEADRPLTGVSPEPVTLAYDENELTFSYVGLHFLNPSHNRYTYQLEGYDRTWHEGGTDRTAIYTSLSPGTYTFRVKAANSDGVWNEEGRALAITILPPWWRSWWAYALYGVFFLGGVFVVDRWQRRRLIAREREAARERELEQAREIEKAYTQLKATQAQLIQQEKMASLGQLTAGIAHEIKNPLNFVNNFSEIIVELSDELKDLLTPHLDASLQDEADDFRMILGDLEQNAQVINQHGKRADGIVQAMMQHASGGSGQREVTDINALVNEYLDLGYHGKRAQQPDLAVDIKRDLDEDVGNVEIVPQEIGRVLLNLLGNAFDAVYERADAETGYEPTVTVSTRRNGETVEIRVSDNGPGIPTALRKKIFEPFFTTKPTGSGTGLGLSLSYDIVTQGHGGMLAVESTEGEGATFVITLSIAR